MPSDSQGLPPPPHLSMASVSVETQGPGPLLCPQVPTILPVARWTFSYLPLSTAPATLSPFPPPSHLLFCNTWEAIRPWGPFLLHHTLLGPQDNSLQVLDASFFVFTNKSVLKLKESKTRGSVAKIYCSCRVPEFSPQHPHSHL